MSLELDPLLDAVSAMESAASEAFASMAVQWRVMISESAYGPEVVLRVRSAGRKWRLSITQAMVVNEGDRAARTIALRVRDLQRDIRDGA